MPRIDACPMINITAVENEPVAYACLNKDESIKLIPLRHVTLIAEQIIAEAVGLERGPIGGLIFNTYP